MSCLVPCPAAVYTDNKPGHPSTTRRDQTSSKDNMAGVTYPIHATIVSIKISIFHYSCTRSILPPHAPPAPPFVSPPLASAGFVSSPPAVLASAPAPAGPGPGPLGLFNTLAGPAPAAAGVVVPVAGGSEISPSSANGRFWPAAPAAAGAAAGVVPSLA